MTITGRARSSNYLRINSSPTSSVLEVLNPSDPLEVLEDAGAMWKVKSNRLWPPRVGYVLKSGVAIDRPPLQVFQKLNLPDGTMIDSVPPSLLAVEFEAWLQSNGEPTWLFEDGDAPFLVGDQIRREFEPYRPMWVDWFAGVVSTNRTQFAVMDEWFAVLNGGKGMWSFRTERIFDKPSERGAGLGWVTAKDILHWTGRAAYSEKETKYKSWYEVNLTKLDREIKGWYKADLLEEYVIPEVFLDPNDLTQATRAFDLTRPALRLPQDPEIDEAKQTGQRAYQYINVKRAIGWGQINKNLCGQFCVAALAGVDVIPFLQNWRNTSPRARQVLEKDQGTVIYDLQSMLAMFNRKSAIFKPEPSVAPATPAYLLKMVRSGKKAILGVGVTPGSGRISYGGRIRHWAVLVDVLRMGNSAWLRIYNPYFNREEIYPHYMIFDMKYPSTLGLWVDD